VGGSHRAFFAAQTSPAITTQLLNWGSGNGPGAWGQAPGPHFLQVGKGPGPGQRSCQQKQATGPHG